MTTDLRLPPGRTPHASSDFVQAILDALPAHIAVIDESGTIVAVNAAWRRFADANGLGLPGAGVGVNYLALSEAATGADAATARAMAQGIRRVLAGELAEFTLEYPCHGPETPRWFLGRVTPLAGANPSRAVVTHDDITDRKLAELALQAQDERLRLGIEVAGLALAEIDTIAAVIHLSAEAARLYGVGETAMTVSRAAIEAAIHPDDRRTASPFTASSRACDAAATTEHRVVWPNGKIRWVSVRRRTFRDAGQDVAPGGEARRTVLAALDITDRKAAEAERTAFLDAIAHDVKNPLTAAKGQAQLLRRRVDRGRTDLVQLATSAGEIEASIGRATALLDELLDAARLESGEPLELHPAPLDLVELARAAVATAQATTERHQVRLDATRDALVGWWDGARLRRVLDNLLGNAIKYSPAGRSVLVEIAEETDAAGAGWARLAVTDQGVGIPAADLPRVFERFHRGGNVSSRIAGNGIGLSGAQRIVAQHGGAITVASREGVGSTFTVRLPIGGAGEGNRGNDRLARDDHG